jgi:hypothetical protein
LDVWGCLEFRQIKSGPFDIFRQFSASLKMGKFVRKIQEMKLPENPISCQPTPIFKSEDKKICKTLHLFQLE